MFATLTFPKPYWWDSSDEIGVTVKPAIISEQALREYIREVITKESTGWYLGPTADQEAVKTKEGNVLQEVIGQNIVHDLEEQASEVHQSNAGGDDGYRMIVLRM